MALHLIDCRIKITQQSDAVLELIHQQTGKDKSEIHREAMHEWAMKEFDKLRLLNEIMVGKGLPRELEGASGR